jgi:hypothetical protein
VAAATMQVNLNGHALGALTVGRDFRPYTITIAPDVAAEAATRVEPSRLTLMTNVWRPRDTLGTPDDRQLGGMIDRVEVR